MFNKHSCFSPLITTLKGQTCDLILGHNSPVFQHNGFNLAAVSFTFVEFTIYEMYEMNNSAANHTRETMNLFVQFNYIIHQ